MRVVFLAILFAALLPAPAAESRENLVSEGLKDTPSGSVAVRDQDRDIELVRNYVKEGRYEEALAILAPYSGMAMEYPRVYTDYLVVLVWAGQHREAIRRFEELPPVFVKRLYLLEAMGKAYALDGQHVRAARLYEQVTSLDPTNDQARLGLLRALLKAGQFQRAGRLLDAYLAENPRHFSLQLIRAGLLMRRGEYLQSLRSYRQLAREHELERDRITLHREGGIAALSSLQRREMLDRLQAAVASGEEDLFEDYLTVLVMHSDYGQALQEFEARGRDPAEFSLDLRYWIGWAYFKRGDIDSAQKIYEAILEEKSDYKRAELGIIYCIARKKNKVDEALARLDKLEAGSTEVQFARAYILEQSGRLWDALRLYDEIFAKTGNRLAEKLKLQVIAAMGAASVALDRLSDRVPGKDELRYMFLGDFAMRDIRWKEPLRAQKQLESLMGEHDILRNHYDYLIALAENDDLAGAKRMYEELEDKGIFRPYWVKNSAAKAYLYFDEPGKALKLYNEVLEKFPLMYESRLGKFYALQDLRLWREAEEVLAGLEKDHPLFRNVNGRKKPDEKGEEVALVKGWSLVMQDRFQEAEDYFHKLLMGGPANLGVRNGLAHTHYWRGWPRKALREFNIIHSLDPEYPAAATGRIALLNELAHKEEARQAAKELLAKFPKNKHVQRVNHLLEIEEKRELVTDVVWYREEPESDDLLFKAVLYQPLNLYTRLYGFWLWNETSDRRLMHHLRRAGLGVDHIFNSSWRLRQQFSVNYETGEEFGSLTRLRFTPDDNWQFMAAYDSFAVDIPMRARVHGIDAEKYEAGITWRGSDRHSCSLGATRFAFDDGNNRDQLTFNAGQSLWTGHDWKFRLLVDLYGSWNSRQGVPYFNPAHDFSFTATLLTEKLVRRTTFASFKHRLFLTGGLYDQADYDPEPIWSVRYEQEYDFSDEHALLVGATWSNRAYDGIARDSLALYLTYRYHF